MKYQNVVPKLEGAGRIPTYMCVLLLGVKVPRYPGMRQTDRQTDRQTNYLRTNALASAYVEASSTDPCLVTIV